MSKQVRERRMVVNKNRVFIGILLLFAALAIAMYLIPRYLSGRQIVYPVLSVTRDIAPGSTLCENDITISKTSDKSLARAACAEPHSVVGKTTTRQLFAGRYLFCDDVAESYTAPTIYNTLPEGYLLMSISTSPLASSVAGQIRANDIIRIFSLDVDGSANTPPELHYVKVLAVYDSQGSELYTHATTIRANNSSALGNSFGNNSTIPISSKALTDTSSENEQRIPAYISLLVTQKQALRLVELEKRGDHYISLVSRDNEELESKMLEWQAVALDGNSKGMSG